MIALSIIMFAGTVLSVIDVCTQEGVDIPYHAIVEHYKQDYKRELLCSGAILNEFWVLTSASCISDAPQSYRVRYATTKSNQGQIGTVASFVKHNQADLALLYMPSNAPLELEDDQARATSIPRKKIYIMKKKVRVSGYEMFNSTSLKFILDMAIVNSRECHKAWTDQPKNCVCINPEVNFVADIGSPVVIDDYLVGIITETDAPGTNMTKSALMIRLDKYREWINQVTSL